MRIFHPSRPALFPGACLQARYAKEDASFEQPGTLPDASMTDSDRHTKNLIGDWPSRLKQPLPKPVGDGADM
jgi:hypothetical protein